MSQFDCQTIYVYNFWFFFVHIDGKYYATIRAINKVDYGGPLSTSVCHTIPLTIDITAPLIYEIYDLSYDDDNFNLTAKHNTRYCCNQLFITGIKYKSNNANSYTSYYFCKPNRVQWINLNSGWTFEYIGPPCEKVRISITRLDYALCSLMQCTIFYMYNLHEHKTCCAWSMSHL